MDWREQIDKVNVFIENRFKISLYAVLWGFSIQNDRPQDKIDFIQVFIDELDLATRLLTDLKIEMERWAEVEIHDMNNPGKKIKVYKRKRKKK